MQLGHEFIRTRYTNLPIPREPAMEYAADTYIDYSQDLDITERFALLNLAHFSGTGPQLSDRDLFYLASAGYLDKDKKSLESITPKGIIAVNMVGVEIDGVDGDISCYLREPFADVSILGIIRNLALNRTTSVLI